jgi:hypothetical protein
VQKNECFPYEKPDKTDYGTTWCGKKGFKKQIHNNVECCVPINLK